jgi:hypothetical protein
LFQDTISESVVCGDALFVCDKKKNGRAIVTQEDLAKMKIDLFGGLANDRKKTTE